MTGTAVNPLFRAAYLAKNSDRDVTLVIPWLSLKDQVLVYPNKIMFSSLVEHEAYVHWWLKEKADVISGFKITFYPGKFSKEKRSILPVGDITETIPDEVADIAILEEPEHLTWYHHGRRWKTKFRKVIGVVHTNYLEYVKREKNGQIQAFLLKYVNSWVIQIYCHKVSMLQESCLSFKVLFYKVFINPSTTDVVCTTTAEALAMGKIVICANHPSNEFFRQFPNCHMYNTSNEFVQLTLRAIVEEPLPLTDDLRHALSWEAATERFVEAAELNEAIQEKTLLSPKPLLQMSSDDWRKSVEEASAFLHNTVSGIEVARCAFGAIPETLQPDEQLCKELGLGFPEHKIDGQGRSRRQLCASSDRTADNRIPKGDCAQAVAASSGGRARAETATSGCRISGDRARVEATQAAAARCRRAQA
ncbi:hypothetical protein BHM03_00056987, partial [Ensete ventricosum]